MAERKRGPDITNGATISARRPGIIEGLTDATLGAGLRQIERLRGASEQDAYRRAGDVMSGIEGVTGLQRTEQSGRNILAGRGEADDYLNVGLMALPLVGRATPLLRRGVMAADEALAGQRLANYVVPHPNPAAKTSILEGRGLTSPEQVKYAQRNISTAELVDVLKRGRFNAPPKGSKHSEIPAKWWSAADEQGVFGRTWVKGDHTVRVPNDKVTAGRAVSAKHAEIFDPATKDWVPLGAYAKKYAIGGIVVDDGNPAKRRKLI